MNTVLQSDILRYKKNKFAANFALGALVFNCLYFMVFYTVHVDAFYTPLLGGSVILNLLVLLAGFYASEGIKGYNKNFGIVLIVLAVVQVIRILIYPLMGMINDTMNGNIIFGITMTTAGNAIIMIVILLASAACFAVAAVHGYITAVKLEKFQKQIDSNEVSVEAVLKELDEQDAQKEANNG